MFVTTIEKKDRPKNGTRAFTDDEEREIYRLVTEEHVRPELIAAELGVSFNTIGNVLKRQKENAA
jgi:DNA invertase Pin-like site-specific DNA recombinase